MRKLRPDSTIGSLSPELKDQVDELLLSGAAYRKVQELLAEADIALSLTSISEYYQRQILPAKLARQNRTAQELNKIAANGLDEATLQAIRSTVFDLASAPGCNAKGINTLFSLVLKAEALKQDDRRLTLEIDKWQRLAAQALLDKALSPEVQKIVGGNASNEDKINMLRPLLFGAMKTINPVFNDV